MRFHMTSRWPYWSPKTILWELNSFLIQTLSFVAIEILNWDAGLLGLPAVNLFYSVTVNF